MTTTNQKIAIFRTGTHTAMDGATLTFGDADLIAMAAAYNPDRHEAPLVVGHPATDGPAYGWVKGLSLDGGVLYADPQQVDPAFADLVRAGRYKKISASFYPPGAAGNPAPGGYYLRHVGFLGAQPPAVKGLKSAEFAGDDGAVTVTVDFSETDSAGIRRAFREIAGFFRRLREKTIEKDGIAAADNLIPEWGLESLESAAHPSDPAKPDPEFSEPHQSQETSMPPPEDQDHIAAAKEVALQAREQALAAKEAAFAEREGSVQRQADATRQAGDAEFAEKLVTAGRMLPRHKPVVTAILDRLAAGADLSFAEESGKRVNVAAPAAFREFLEALPVQVDFTERSGGQGDVEAASFIVPPGFTVDRDDLALHARIQAHADTHNISFAEAASAVGGR